MSNSFITEKLNLHDWWDIPIACHPTKTGKTIINIPGAGGSINGYKNKYLNLGNYIQEKELASFVRIPNDRPQEPLLTARTVINYSIENAKKICGKEKPEIWLMGFSAGVASILLTAWEYPEITKILVINPFIDFKDVRKEVKKHLTKFEGEVCLVIGEEDSVIATDTIEYVYKYSNNIKAYVVPQCDHQLRGEENIRILSQLPEFVFLGKYKEQNSLPVPEEGVNLLDT